LVQENGFSSAKLEKTLPIMMQDKKIIFENHSYNPQTLNLKIKFETLKFRLEHPKPNFPNP
jgi:hypothetical protein